MNSKFFIKNRWVGTGQPVFIAAEIGINHNGDINLAKKMIDSAAQAGADGVKFQNFKTEDFISNRDLQYKYTSQGRQVIESQFDMFKRCELSKEQLLELRNHCDQAGLVFFSTPTSEDGLLDLIKTGAMMVKNGSDYLTHLPLIRAMAKSDLITILSTGMANESEIEDAVQAYSQDGGAKLILLHCTSAYPTPDSEVNLKRIPRLSSNFDCPIGFSDHTVGINAALGAVALGACFIEKHFTLDKELPGPDQLFSSDPLELRELVNGVRQLERQLGSDAIRPTVSEESNRLQYRLSCTAVSSKPAGSSISFDDIAFRRPGFGLQPKFAARLVGRYLKVAISQGHIFSESDFLD